MSAISATSTSQLRPAQRPQPPSEKDRLASAIGGAVSAGTITGADATALTSAVEAIDSSLTADRGSGSSGAAATSGSTARTRLDPSGLKDRIDGLIADQVSGGTLTSDQADTLKALFAQTAKGHGHGHGHGGGTSVGGTSVGGSPPAPPSGDGTDAASGSGSPTDDLLASFIQQLQSARSSGSGYAASGSAGTSTAASALLFDFQS